MQDFSIPTHGRTPRRFCAFAEGVTCPDLCLRREDDYKSCSFLGGKTPAEHDAALEMAADAPPADSIWLGDLD